MANVLSPLRLYRKNFGKIERIVDISNLIEMQKESYRRFLQKDVPPEARSEYGLHGVFKSVFPSGISAAPAPWSSWSTAWATPSTTWTSASSGA